MQISLLPKTKKVEVIQQRRRYQRNCVISVYFCVSTHAAIYASLIIFFLSTYTDIRQIPEYRQKFYSQTKKFYHSALQQKEFEQCKIQSCPVCIAVCRIKQFTYLANLSPRRIVVNNRNIQTLKHFQTLLDCLNVIINPPLKGICEKMTIIEQKEGIDIT